jgi:amino acid adenylation domain-containing protein
LQDIPIPFEDVEIQDGIAARFRRVAAVLPAKLAVKSPDHEYTYQELDRLAERIAGILIARSGGTAEPVALLLNNDARITAAILGVLYSGKFYCALHPGDPAPRLSRILSDLGGKLLLTDSAHLEHAGRIAPQGCQVVNLEDDCEPTLQVPVASPVTGDTLAGIFYTSGSTGTAKGVPRNCATILHRTWLDVHEMGITPQDRLMVLRSCSFAGSLVDIFDALLTGASLVVFDASHLNPTTLIETVRQEGITLFHPPLELLRVLLRTNPPGLTFPSVRYLVLSGDVLYRRDVEMMRSFFPPDTPIYYHMSSSETGLLTRFVIRTDTPLAQDIVPVGYPVEGKEILLLGDDDRELPSGEIGEIAVRTQFRFTNYWGKTEKSDNRFVVDPDNPGGQLFKTGDMGRWDAEGRLEFLGRKDFQVKIHGYRVSLPVVEACLNGVQEVQHAVVLLRQDRSGQKRITAYLIPRPNTPLTISHLRAEMNKVLPTYMIPSAFVFLEEFPLTSNGKIDRQSLPEPEWESRHSDDEYLSARNEAERRLVELWQDNLGIQKIGVRDDFFTLGGDSLRAAEILAGMEKSFGVTLPLAFLLENRTIEQMAVRLQREDMHLPIQRLIAIQPNGSRPPLFLFPGHFGDTFYFRFLSQHLGPDQPVHGIELVSPGGDTISTLDLVETARRCVDEIRTLQTHGPYYLAGHSFGGLLAYEIAQQLNIAGEKVPFLGLFDTTAPGYRARAPWPERIRIHLRNLRDLNRQERWRYLRERFRNILIKSSGNQVVRSTFARLKLLPQDVSARNRIASRVYEPKPYPGELTVFRSLERAEYKRDDPTEGWKRYTERVRMIDVPGDHATLLREPHVAVLAQELGECLSHSDP